MRDQLSYYEGKLKEGCPECDNGSPTMCADHNNGRHVRCENCGYETEVFRDPIKHEGTRRLVRRWNKQVSTSSG